MCGMCRLLRMDGCTTRECARPQVVAAATAAAEQLGASHARLVSRAYHDALFMAQVCRRHPCPHKSQVTLRSVSQGLLDFPCCSIQDMQVNAASHAALARSCLYTPTAAEWV